MKYKISDSQKQWVEANFLVLIKACGFPWNKGEQILLNQHFFPNTFNSKEIEIENIIKDLITIFDFGNKIIKYEIIYDLRDSNSFPLAIRGKFQETELDKVSDNEYCIYISNSTKEMPNRLIFCLINDFLRIKLSDAKIPHDQNKYSENFLFLAGIYFGFGVILTQKRIDTGKSSTSFWQKKWNFSSSMLVENIIYGFALYQKIFPSLDISWMKELPKDFESKINEVASLVHSSMIADVNEAEAKYFLKKSLEKSKKDNFILAIELLNKVITLSNDHQTISTAYNNTGYLKLKIGFIEESSVHFKKAIEYRPDFGFANDNLGYSLILRNLLDEGLVYLEKAEKTLNNDKGYHYRNLGLYFHKKGELLKAKEYYDQAFDHQKRPIDFLEYHFSELLSEIGDEENADKFLKIAVDKREKIAMDKFN
ncbi:hypothetical protein GCM10023210_39030 [Chryseobacterium ginsengisoli]|uniref:Tetratricopeptide repeat protein n=1 Tax=Chryseobacterium ginsengisoli TaxID=363853 RepID=A0ABP9MR47_9FLAO